MFGAQASLLQAVASHPAHGAGLRRQCNQVLFMDRDDILNLFTVTNLPLPAGALPDEPPKDDDMPF